MSKLTDKQRKELYIRYSCAALQGILANPNRGGGKPEAPQARDYAIDMITQFENVFYEDAHTYASGE